MYLLLTNIEILKTAIYSLEDRIAITLDKSDRLLLVKQLARADQLLMAYYTKMGELVC